ncbi:MAG TPA: hypothetical protein VKY37_01240 [Brumimicrobium sp.]|nr:hypothetical protein [Brumimicrobium sp.]
MNAKYWIVFLSVVSMNVIFTFLKITGIEFVIFSMIIPCLILLWIKYDKLSKKISGFDKQKFENESVYLKALDLHYLNPFSALIKNKKDNEIIKKAKDEYKFIVVRLKQNLQFDEIIVLNDYSFSFFS